MNGDSGDCINKGLARKKRPIPWKKIFGWVLIIIPAITTIALLICLTNLSGWRGLTIVIVSCIVSIVVMAMFGLGIILLKK